MTEEVFSPERLRLARQRRSLLVQELAAKIGVTRRSISSWENSTKEPASDNVSALAAALDYPRAYFFLPAPPSLEGGTFRSLARMTAKQGAAAKAAAIQAVELDGWIGTHYKRPEPQVPDLRDVAPETAAEMVRADWGIGYRPLPNLVHLLERHGVRVYSLVHHGVEVDAFSAWCGNTPFVFLNTSNTAERSRMDASHELGHLVLHYHAGQEGSRLQEAEAQSFAAAFLMPKNAFIASAPRRPTLATILTAKQQWGVSAAAYAYRLHSLGMMPYWAYRDVCIKLRTMYGSSEPMPAIPRETSQVLAKVLSSKDSGGVTRRNIASALQVRLRDLDEMTFGLTLTAVSGGGHGGAESPRTGDLRLVR